MNFNKKVPSTSTRRDISMVIAKEHKIPQSLAYGIIDTTFKALLANLMENGHVELRGFGVFEVSERKARRGRNPRESNTEVWIPARKVVKFKVSKLLRTDIQSANLPAKKSN